MKPLAPVLSALKTLPSRLRPRNLWRQLALLVTISLVIISIGYVFYSVNYISEHLGQSAKKEMSALARNIAMASAGPVLLNDFATVEKDRKLLAAIGIEHPIAADYQRDYAPLEKYDLDRLVMQK